MRNGTQLLTTLHQGEDVTLVDTNGGSTYLHLLMTVAHPACEAAVVPMIYMLSNAGVDVNAEDSSGHTALHHAIDKELVDCMAALVRVGVDPTTHDYPEVVRAVGSPFELEMADTLDKYAPGLWAAVAQNNTALVHMLLNSWCRLSINKNGITLLQFAQGTNKSPELCALIEDCEVSLEFVHATLAGDEKRMLEFLMDSKPCDPAMMDISYQERWCQPLQPRSLRDTAIAMGHTHVLHLLPEGEEEQREQGEEPTAAETQMEEQAESSSSSSTFSSVVIPREVKKAKSADTKVPSQTEETWNDFYFHPNAYLQLPSENHLPTANKKWGSRSALYRVKDYKWSPHTEPKSKHNRSKMCIIS